MHTKERPGEEELTPTEPHSFEEEGRRRGGERLEQRTANRQTVNCELYRTWYNRCYHF